MQSTIIIPHETVADLHVELTLDVTGYLVTDLVGEGATLLNGHPLEKDMSYQLEAGTQLSIGGVIAVYDCEVEPEPVAPPAPVDFPVPGSFPRPVQPAGLFTPVKQKGSPMLVLSILLTLLALGAAGFFGMASADIHLPH